MDFALVQLYRNVYSDVSMLTDSCEAYIQVRKPAERTLAEFSAGVQDIMNMEAANPYPLEESVKSTYDFATIRSRRNLMEDDNDDEMDLRVVLWDFYRSVFLEFTCDEMSQFIFWATKVRMCTGPMDLGTSSLALAFFRNIKERLTTFGGIGAMQGCGPFIAAAFVHNFAHFEDLVRSYLSVTLSSGDVDPSMGPSLRRATNDVETIDEMPLMVYVNGVILRASTRVFAHPFLLVAVRQVCSPSAQPFPLPGSSRAVTWAMDATWFKSAWDYYKAEGSALCFFRGLRSSFTAALVPFSPFLLFGIAEMVMYRRVLGDSGGGGASVTSAVVQEGAKEAATGAMGAMKEVAGPSANVINDIICSEGGYASILRYGQLTMLQVIPGFVSFVASRSALWFIFGATKRRQKQRRRRIRRLRHYWGTYILPPSVQQQQQPGSPPRLRNTESSLTDTELELEDDGLGGGLGSAVGIQGGVAGGGPVVRTQVSFQDLSLVAGGADGLEF